MDEKQVRGGGGYQVLMFAKFKENFRTFLLGRSYVNFAEQQNAKYFAEIQLMRILCFKRLILGFEKRENEIQNEVAKGKSFQLSYFLVII